MADLIPLKGNPSFARDPSSNAIININTQEIYNAKQRKAKRLEQEALISSNDAKITLMNEQLDSLENKINLILEKI
jgi:hypothetical protein